MSDLGQVIAARLAGWEELHVEHAIFGTGDPEQIAGAVGAFCEEALGAGIEAALFYESSQGAVSGLRLRDGRAVVVKAHQPNREATFLAAVHHVQCRLADQGFPCPRPILGPCPLGNGLALVEELVDEGSYRDAHDPAIRRALAETLARLVAITDGVKSMPGMRADVLSRRLPDALWPAPHHTMFDFEATAAGAEWIDRIAGRAKRVMACSAGPLVLGHTDWSVKHFRFQGETIRVIYDWDSLALEPEPLLVGHAAATFTMTWHLDVPLTPTQEEAYAFAGEYEAARGQAFTTLEWEAIAAAATYSWAYGARCEHSLHPTEADFPPGSLRTALALRGDARFP